ncbi:MAG: leucine--tRNA ligase [Patescibacteria group bacterium]
MSFDHRKIELKWQKYWEKEGLYQAKDFDKRLKQYILIEFPYPSGERLHVGHGRSYCCLDAVARLQRMKGRNVLFPIGWDAFGLPAENYAIKTGIHPSITTKENIANAKKQAQSWGLSFDWEREINTTDPDYYRWTQWIFLQLYQKGLAYKAEIPVNWCPKDKTNLADEEVVAGKCERCGTPVERRTQSQWLLKITAYADRLIDDLETVDYREDIKAQQVNWIGRSEGAKIAFKILDLESKIEVFTTRPDTLYGATFLVLSPERAQEVLGKGVRPEVEDYIRKALKKSELQRQEQAKEKTGVFSGFYAQHPLTGEKLPVWVADFVLSGYGTGAIMAVPAHDQRDFEFAKKYDLPVKEVIKSEVGSALSKQPFKGEGTLVNSGEFDGLQSKVAIDKITQFLEQKKLGERAIDYKLRDWVFSRQHYWGEPIPIIFCRHCWERKSEKEQKEAREGIDFVKIAGKEHAVVTVSGEDLPVELPYVENYKPTETGESPLAAVKDWVNVRCPICKSQARRETDTMPNWAGSSWYFLRYLDPKNDKKFANPDKLKYWLPVDWYNGGMEHTTLHLLYSRFWHKVLFDLGLVPTKEPYARRTSHGVVLGTDGQKMSKSRGNVTNPDEVVAEFGADTFRMYEAFMGPFEQMIAWDPKGVLGVHRFLDRVWKAHEEVSSQQPAVSSKELERELHRLIKKVEEDTLNLKFNTAIAAMMAFINEVASSEYLVAREDWQLFLEVLAPYAPHLSEELWHDLGEEGSVHRQSWPKWDPKLIKEETVTIAIQVNGKFRGTVAVSAGAAEEEVVARAREVESVKRYLEEGKTTAAGGVPQKAGLAKTIFVPDNLINFVVS